MGAGHYLRPLAFYLSQPAFEVVVQELQINPESNVWKRVARGIRRVPETGQPREIAFRIGGGFPGYSHWYVWRADDKKPEFFGGGEQRTRHWYELTVN